ncbi:hypothetical protein FOA52_008699 [Chlamydomonas sp. UWO 241]|nr:hypothetical protein FOA52_008699 [Chlamydomonas sp. UWO 241]
MSYMSNTSAGYRESGDTRDVDCGACAYHANRSYYVDKGWIKPDGIFATCTNTAVAPAGGGPVFTPPVKKTGNLVYGSTTDCLACMETTFDYIGLGGLTPENTSKAYACASCRHPDWIKDKGDATMCFDCVANANVYNAWGCNYCWEAKFLTGDDSVDTLDCMTCVQDNPYQDKVGSYNWACAECASITDGDLRALCIACIMTPASDAGYNATMTPSDDVYKTYATAYALKLDSTEWVGNASEIVCSCVDMAKASTWGVGGLEAWYISSCPDCTAMQKSCFKRRNITWSEIPNHRNANGTVSVEDPRVPFIKVVNAELPDGYVLSFCDTLEGLVDEEKTYLISVLGNSTCSTESESVRVNDTGDIACVSAISNIACRIAVPDGAFSGYMLVHLDETIQVNDTGSSCVACMRNFTTGASSGMEDFAYACEQYCMNTYTISNTLLMNWS